MQSSQAHPNQVQSVQTTCYTVMTVIMKNQYENIHVYLACVDANDAQEWAKRPGPLKPGEDVAGCVTKHKRLHDKLGPCVKKAIKRTGITQLVIVSHPAIRARISDLLQHVSHIRVCYMQLPGR